MIQLHKYFHLTFHGIGDPPIPIHNDEKRVWVCKKLFKQFCRLAVNHKDRIIITFDDGNNSDYEIAMLELLSLNLTGIFFVLTGRIGSKGYLTKNNLRELIKHGMVIGLHGRDHRDWKKLNDSELDLEIIKSKEILQDIIGAPIDKAACPFGSYDQKVIQKLKSTNIKSVYTSDRGLSNRGDWLISRNSVQKNDSVDKYIHLIKSESSFFNYNKQIRALKKMIKRYR